MRSYREGPSGILGFKFKHKNKYELSEEQIQNLDSELNQGKEAELIVCR